jgi:hypothetical protein
VVFKVTVPSKLFENKLTLPLNNDMEEVIKVPDPDESFVKILSVLGEVVDKKVA